MAAYEVLVVEDEKLIRDNLVEKIGLCDPGFTVVAAAANGADALAILQSRHIDVVFTDVRMPVMDGLSLAQQIRRRYPQLPVVIVSGYAEFDYAQQAIHAGVEEYLLKPVKPDLLAEALSRIKARLGEAGSRTQLQLVREALNGSPTETPATGQQAYRVCLLNIGNLCTTIPSIATRNALNTLWSRFDLPTLLPAYPGCLLVDGPQPNCRYLVWQAPELAAPALARPPATGQELFEHLTTLASGISVNLICGSAQGLDGLYEQAGALNLALSQGLVFDESKVLEVERLAEASPDAPPAKPPAAVLDAAVYGRLTALLGQEGYRALQAEVRRLIETALALKRSQLWLQDYVRQLIRLFQRHAAFASEAEIYHAEYALFDKMALPGSSLTLFDQVWAVLGTLLRDTSREAGPGKELIEAIQGYIRAGFNRDITLEEIARRFNFAPSYLIRIFKKQVGVTPIQYLIDLRMAEARRLMLGDPDLDIKAIGELVGYPDPHYFSRIFKNTQGLAPTEYRARHSPASPDHT